MADEIPFEQKMDFLEMIHDTQIKNQQLIDELKLVIYTPETRAAMTIEQLEIIVARIELIATNKLLISHLSEHFIDSAH